MWIISDSYVRGAQRAAETFRSNLSMPEVRVCWFGWGGLWWKGLLPFFSNSMQGRAGEVSSVKLVNMMKEDLHQLHLRHPGVKIVFSCLIPRCRWRAGANQVKIDKARKFVNSVMATFVRSLNGAMIEH